MPESARKYFEPRFGHDFSSVRVHNDSSAADSAKAINARAYTLGSDVVFGAGHYKPETGEGRSLLAHELTHVVQQQAGNEERLSRSPDCSEWGGFRICGNAAFVRRIRDDLNTLNGTSQGSALLGAIAAHRAPWYRSLIRIESSSACGLSGTSGNILFNASGCGVTDRCPGSSSDWASVPNYVYLFHEIVHAYLYHVTGQGTNPDRECMVTGLGRYFVSMPYNENRLRCELGLPVRPCYDGECSRYSAPSCVVAGERGGRVRPKTLALRHSQSGLSVQLQNEEEKGPEETLVMKNCSVKITEQIAMGIVEAKQMSALALVALKRDIPMTYENKALRENFGPLDSDARRTVVSRYENIQATLENKEIECKSKCPKKGTDLCAQAEIPGKKIFICPNFGTTGCAPGPTMLHEAAHNAGAKDDVDKGDKYPPKNAENNAYAYEYFPQDLRKGPPEVKLRPKKEVEIEAL